MLGLLALLTDHRRPTVAEALKIGFRKVFSYIGAYLIAGFAIALAAFVLIGLTAAVSTALAFVGVIALFLILAYAMVKLSLVPAVLVKEDVANPITALSRSWRLTKGNSFRLFFFYFLIVLVMIINVIAGRLRGRRRFRGGWGGGGGWSSGIGPFGGGFGGGFGRGGGFGGGFGGFGGFGGGRSGGGGGGGSW
jgi:hypothetical protein